MISSATRCNPSRVDYRRRACENLALGLKELHETMSSNPQSSHNKNPNAILANFWAWLAKGVELPIWGPAMQKTTRVLQLDPQSQYLCIIQYHQQERAVTAMMHLSEVRECVWRNKGFLFFPNPNSTEVELAAMNGMKLLLEFPSRGLLDYFRWRMAELIFAVDRLQKQYELGVGRNLNSPNQLDAGGALDLLETDYQDPWADDHDNLLDTSRTVGGSNPQECHVMHLPSCGPDNCLFNPFSCISALLCIKSDAEYHSRSQEVVGCGPCLTDYSKDPNASVEVLLLGQDSPNVLTWEAQVLLSCDVRFHSSIGKSRYFVCNAMLLYLLSFYIFVQRWFFFHLACDNCETSNATHCMKDEDNTLALKQREPMFEPCGIHYQMLTFKNFTHTFLIKGWYVFPKSKDCIMSPIVNLMPICGHFFFFVKGFMGADGNPSLAPYNKVANM